MRRDIAPLPAKNSPKKFALLDADAKFSLPLIAPSSLLRSVVYPSFSTRYPPQFVQLLVFIPPLRYLFYLFSRIFLCTVGFLVPSLFVLSVSCFLIISLLSSVTLLTHPSPFSLSLSFALIFSHACTHVHISSCFVTPLVQRPTGRSVSYQLAFVLDVCD